MTIAATGISQSPSASRQAQAIGLWPRHTLYRLPCRRCGEQFQQTAANQKYCTSPECVAWRERKERERARGRGK